VAVRRRYVTTTASYYGVPGEREGEGGRERGEGEEEGGGRRNMIHAIGS
jgi:hypothetical protein